MEHLYGRMFQYLNSWIRYGASDYFYYFYNFQCLSVGAFIWRNVSILEYLNTDWRCLTSDYLDNWIISIFFNAASKIFIPFILRPNPMALSPILRPFSSRVIFFLSCLSFWAREYGAKLGSHSPFLSCFWGGKFNQVLATW